MPETLLNGSDIVYVLTMQVNKGVRGMTCRLDTGQSTHIKSRSSQQVDLAVFPASLNSEILDLDTSAFPSGDGE